MKIDSHHHFWTYNTDEFGWIDDSMAAIRRSFHPADLAPLLPQADLDGVVTVQARQSLAETNWLLELAAQNDFIRGVVGWVPLIDPKVGDVLESLQAAGNPKLRAVRHVLQGEADEYMLQDAFHRGLDLLPRFGLVYDILIFERQLAAAVQLVDRHPNQVFVLDHIAKPRIRDLAIEPWRTWIRELARRPNVYVKLSGMVTEADFKAWTPDQLRAYAEITVDAFGPKRTMIGSDWPVCLVACDYVRWHQLARSWIAKLSPAEQARVLGGTAIEAYGLK